MNSTHPHSHRRPRALARGLLALVALAALLAGCGPQAVTPPPAQAIALGGVGPEVYTLARPAVVRIDAGLRTGAGIVVGPGEVLTAAHVVRDAHRIAVATSETGPALAADIVGYDEPLDLALLSVPGLDAPALALADAASLPQPGLEVWTLGHPNGQAWSIARGVVSQVDAASGTLLSSLVAEPGSSGGPVLVYRAAGALEVAGLVSRVLPAEGHGPAAVVTARAIVAALPALRGGTRVGLADPEAFVATVHNRSPLVHDIVMARRVALDGPGEDVLDQLHHTLEFATFPVAHTLELRTTWRYFFEGAQTFRYRVVRLEGDQLVTLHDGPLRTFELAGERTSYVHKVEIDVDLPAAGDYAVLVETNERLSAVLPFAVVEKGQAAPPGPAPSWPFEAAPLQHSVIVAAKVEGSALDATAGAATTPVSVRGTFNTVRLPADPVARRVRFDSWTVWSGGFEGEHTFEHRVIDATGQTIAQAQSGTFRLEDSRAAHEHVARWDVELPAAGLYFLLTLTDGRITRAMPIWVQAE